jgi:anthranilate synthase component 2
MKLVIIDNNDSFTHNLAQLAEEAGCRSVTIVNERLADPDLLEESEGIILSPGPGLPTDHPGMTSVIRRFHQTKPILGICLGHQAIAEFFGARLQNLGRPAHGIAAGIRLTSPRDPLFWGIPEKFPAGLYHSWAVSREGLPPCFRITGISEEGVIMALSHRDYDLKGVQFHPESILTPAGNTMIANWLSLG